MVRMGSPRHTCSQLGGVRRKKLKEIGSNVLFRLGEYSRVSMQPNQCNQVTPYVRWTHLLQALADQGGAGQKSMALF